MSRKKNGFSCLAGIEMGRKAQLFSTRRGIGIGRGMFAYCRAGSGHEPNTRAFSNNATV